MTPSAEAVVKLAEVLDVTTGYLLVDDSPRRSLHAPRNILGDRLYTVAETHRRRVQAAYERPVKRDAA